MSYLPSSPPFPDDHDILSFLTFSLSEPDPKVMPALGRPSGESRGRDSPGTPPRPRCFWSRPVQSVLSFQPLYLLLSVYLSELCSGQALFWAVLGARGDLRARPCPEAAPQLAGRAQKRGPDPPGGAGRATY